MVGWLRSRKAEGGREDYSYYGPFSVNQTISVLFVRRCIYSGNACPLRTLLPEFRKRTHHGFAERSSPSPVKSKIMVTPHIFDFWQWWRTRGVIHVPVGEFVEICGWLQHDKGRTLSEFFSSTEVMRISGIPGSLFQSAPLTSQQPGNRWGGWTENAVV
jgi:hypothetical protein